MPPTAVVLIVEDSADCAETLDVALSGVTGLRVEVVSAGEEALRRLRHGGFSVLITDLHLPEMDGIELIEAVRKTDGTTPVIVISGDSHPGTPERARKAGAQAFFAKPYSPAAVRRTVEALIQTGNSKEENK